MATAGDILWSAIFGTVVGLAAFSWLKVAGVL